MLALKDVYNQIETKNIPIIETKFKFKKSCIANYMNNPLICLDSSKIETYKEKKVILEEEYQHYNLGTFYKLNSPFYLIDKMEYKTRKHLYYELVPFKELKYAISKGTTLLWELADYFDVPYKFMQDCIDFYSEIGVLI